MKKPSIEEFLEETPELEFSEDQKKLAEELINYRSMHFSLGRRGGRTTVVNAVKKYFEKVYPDFKNVGREI